MRDWFVKLVFASRAGTGRFILRRKFNALNFDEVMAIVDSIIFTEKDRRFPVLVSVCVVP